MQESYVVHALWNRHETPGVRRHPQTALLLFARPVMDGPTVVALDVVDYPECGALHPAEVGELTSATLGRHNDLAHSNTMQGGYRPGSYHRSARSPRRSDRWS